MADIYSQMQIRQYEQAAALSRVNPGIMEDDTVVGTFHGHNAWQDNHVF